MDKYSDKELQDFVESLYDDANEQLKEVYKEQKQNRDDLLKEIAIVMLSFIIVDSVMKLTLPERNKLNKKFLDLITKYANNQATSTTKIIRGILTNTTKNTYSFYNCNTKLKDVEKIINNNFHGKHFSERVWDNEQEVAKYINSQIQDFLKGKISVNDIKKNIEYTYNTNAYNVKRLTETEVSRCQNESFRRFCQETNVKKIQRHEMLDSKICSECEDADNEIYDINNAPEIPEHPMCRGYLSIVE